MKKYLNELLRDFKKAPVENQRDFISCPKDKLIQYHHTLGRDIRNRFKLWDNKWEPELVNGIDCSPNHPDSISMRIIETLWQTLHDEKN